MKALLVNSQHPDASHIGAVRAARFAAGLAHRGHKVVLLTPVFDRDQSANWRHFEKELLQRRDWSEPMLVTHPMPIDGATPRKGRRAGAVIRKATTATALVFGNGTAAARVAASRPVWRPLIEGFRPDIVWSTFGDTSNLIAARSIARLADAPWIMDLKDNWEAFVPCGLRRIVAWRFRDASRVTSNADYHARSAVRWHRRPIATIYSGVAPEMIASGDRGGTEKFRITLVGGTRGSPDLPRLLSDLQQWIERRPNDERAKIMFCYAGGSADEVTAAVRDARLTCAIDIQKYLSLTDLGRFCQEAALNCYLWDKTTFHHKLLELLACRRPVVAYPGEHEESVALARMVGGSLCLCADSIDVAAALDDAWKSWAGAPRRSVSIEVDAFSWDMMTARLETLMLEAIDERSMVPSRGDRVERRRHERVEFF
ncbi:glycosyltransferase family 4 protein [Methylosinus sp. RM1]|uniref:glycosyltransferase family 4 protein n=1 Tax=Methylosinus sp. RM1 TaxID=2583817 RepID=UPI00140E449E|nr:glycosyltransferase family 4 protein [Methylosinus sp. RM1]